MVIPINGIALADETNLKSISNNKIVSNLGLSSPELNIKYDQKNDDILGPESFCFKNKGGYYLLDTSENKIVSINSDDKIEKEIKLGNIYGTKISSDQNDNVYVLDVAKGIIAKNDSKNTLTQFSIDASIVDAVIDFGVNSQDNVFITYADDKGGKTKYYRLSDGKATLTGEKEGRIASDGVNYKTILVKDPGFDVGHACTIFLMDVNGNVIKELPIKSNHWLEGAIYLGQKDGDYIIQTHEMETDINNNVLFEDIVKIVDKDGNTKLQNILPKEIKYSQNSTIAKDGKVYHFNKQEKNVKIEELGFTENMDSSLDNIKTKYQPDKSNSNSNLLKTQSFRTMSLAMVDRSLIQQTVYSYYSCYWYCTYNNYENWGGNTRPRYITGYNCYYTGIPYNWGGWDTWLGFMNKMNNGTTAGNINTSIVLSNLGGVDCSGYVQRCWGINDEKRSTTGLDASDISFSISAANLKYGDAWNRSDHIMIYHQRDGYGNYILYEATMLNYYDRVAHTTRNASSVESTYHSIRRQNINEDV
jgi:hypothetical protein